MNAFHNCQFVFFYLLSCLVKLLKHFAKLFVQVDDGLEVDLGLVYCDDVLNIESIHLGF